MRKKSKDTVPKLRKKCDDLLTPIVKKKYPKCLLCNAPTQVAHHHVHKSKSTVLRHDPENLINLCHKCHLKLHMNESYWASKIVEIKGLEWFRQLEKRKNKIVKADKFYYQEILEKLSTEFTEL